MKGIDNNSKKEDRKILIVVGTTTKDTQENRTWMCFTDKWVAYNSVGSNAPRFIKDVNVMMGVEVIY